MNTTRPCGCKGHRTCLKCETTYNIPTVKNDLKSSAVRKVVYCPWCNLCYPGDDYTSFKSHPNHQGNSLRYEGIYIQLDFLNDEEHNVLMTGINSMPWDSSQSGRRKQNFGPKCNFKGRKLRVGQFKGFPGFSKFVQEKFIDIPILKDFQTIEQCSLEYDPIRGSSIDPHVDDCWIWGERIVTVNLLSDSVLTMTPNKHPDRYNLDLVKTYPKIVGNIVEPIINQDGAIESVQDEVVLVPMPKNSLLVMYGNARYNYEHRILRDDITERRVCLAYREFTPLYLETGEFYHEGKDVINKAKQFF